MGGRHELLERECELEVLSASLRSAAAGDGGLLLVEGPAGIGKTSLLDRARQRAADSGAAVVSARGSVLERGFGFGVVRQLFETAVVGATARVRRRLLAGAAELATPVVAPGEVSPTSPPVQQSAVLHGLYWLTANLAETTPLLVAVDDLHWSDAPSLQYLTYLAQRLEGMPVLVIGAVRTGDPETDTASFAELAAIPGVEVLGLEALSVDAVGVIVRERLGANADDAFVAACHTASGGVPFLVHELVRTLVADHVAPTAGKAKRIAQIGPSTVARAVALRMARLSEAAVDVARAIAILGPHTRLDRIAVLAGVPELDVRTTRDALARMHILGSEPLIGFIHPLVHRAIYEDMPVDQRADAHARAAELLAAEHAPLDEIAAHLLVSEPAGRPDVVRLLRDAATQAVARGAPQSAVAYLRRAVSEGGIGVEQAAILHELARAETLLRDPRAVDHYEEARRISSDPTLRARMGFELSEFYLVCGLWEQRLDMLSRALAELGNRDPDLAARIEAARAATEGFDPRHAAQLDARMPHLMALLERPGAGPRALAAAVAARLVCRGQQRAQALALIERALDGGNLLRDEGSESLIFPQAWGALVGLDELDAADRAVAGVLADAHQRGSVFGFVAGSLYHQWIDAQRGRLLDATGHFRAAIDLSVENNLTFALPNAFLAGVDLMLERPELDDVAALVESIGLDPAFAASGSGAWVLVVRGRLRALRGERAPAITDLRAAGAVFTAIGFRNPILGPWRSPLALLLPREQASDARALIDAELADARAIGLSRCEGEALRAAGLIEGGDAGITTLRESLAVLDHADAPLEKARTLVELGAALRRADQRVAARQALTDGLTLAQQCGAQRLEEHAYEELRIAGARPRRRAVTGPSALTPSELRVARMAADGLTNRDIAQALFVTAKTVENQLTTTYRKLGARSRNQLAEALNH